MGEILYLHEFRRRGVKTNRATALEFLIAVSQGRSSDVMHLLDERATWWVNGRTRLSGSWPVPELLAQAHAAFASIDGPLEVHYGAVTAEGDRVAVEVRVHVRFVDGRSYANSAHFLLHFERGKIACVKEYLDTEALARLLRVGEPVLSGHRYLP